VLRQEQASVSLLDSDTICIGLPSSLKGRALEIRIRGVSDIEVAFVVPGKKGSPFEQLFVGPSAEETSLIGEVVSFVSDIVNERVALAWASGVLGGGRRFLRARELGPAERRKYAWSVSWAGSLDWERGA
jgi:hypothetical protein